MTESGLTLVIHGTFAAEAGWWRLSDGGSSTFADRLEAALAARGAEGTVWRPALARGMAYDDFAWSGRNGHRDRVQGGIRLARALDALAERLAATPDAPLEVNFVAHSHGGNVVLECLGRLGPAVRPGRVVLLGTPLVAVRPALRLLRLVLGVGLACVLGALALAAGLTVLGVPVVEGVAALELIVLTVGAAVSYGWLFLLVGWVGDGAWRLVARLWWLARGRREGQAYGPGSERLRAILRGPFTLVSSHQDEADLVLQLSAAPRRLYHEWVRERFGRAGRLVELVLARPFVAGMVLPAVTVLLERYVLGFSWPAVLFADYEMADLTGGRAYPSRVVRRVDVTADVLPVLAAQPVSAAVAPSPTAIERATLSGDPRRATGLREAIGLMGRSIAAQVRLRHSMYYESERVVELVAERIAGRR